MVSSAENADEALKVLEQRNDIGYFSPAFKCQARSTEWIWAAAVLNHRRTDNIKELLRRFSVQRQEMLFGIDELRSYVILDYLGHQARHRTPGAGSEIHHLFAARLAVERAARPGPACAARAPATFVSSWRSAMGRQRRLRRDGVPLRGAVGIGDLVGEGHHEFVVLHILERGRPRGVVDIRFVRRVG